MDIVGSLGSVKQLIAAIITEVKAIKAIEQLNTTHVASYEEALVTLDKSITRLQSIYSYDFPVSEQHALKLSVLSLLSKYLFSFTDALKQHHEWCNKTQHGCCLARLCTLMCKPPSKMQEKLEHEFNSCLAVMKDVSNIETEILGSAVRLKHPVLQKAWLFMGINDLNASEIPSNKLQETLFLMLKSEVGGEIKNKEYCFDLIKTFVTRLDGAFCSEPDGKLSINELNEVQSELESVKSLLGFERQPNEVQTLVDVAIEGFNPMIINHLQTSEYQPVNDASYGSGFNNKCAGSMIVPSSPQADLHFYGLNVTVKATDQGWGGTKHAQIRYSVNGANPKPFINIDRIEHADEMYEMKIGPDNVKPGDTVRWWLYCPGWSGWKVNMKDLKVQALFG